MMMKRLDNGLAFEGPTLLRTAWVVGILTVWWIGIASASAGPSVYSRAPIGQYQMASRSQEIALARSAAPAVVADNAQVLVLGEHGYETAVRGGNGFVCLVARSWDQGPQNPGFWNPKIRAPECFNPPGALSVLPRYLQRTKWVLAGKSATQVRALDQAGNAADPDPGSIAYMMSPNSYLGDNITGPGGRAWYPHMMFFEHTTAAQQWGANLPGTPVAANSTGYQGLTIFLVIVPQWSTGTWVAHK